MISCSYFPANPLSKLCRFPPYQKNSLKILCFILMCPLSIFDIALLPVLQVDQLSCNGDRKLQPDRSQAIRERLRGKGLPTGKCFIAVRVMAINIALWKTKFV